MLPEYVERFRERWLGVAVRTATGQERPGWLRGYELELVSMYVALPDIEFHPVLASELVLITAADRALAGRESVGIEAAAAYPFVAHSATRYVAPVAQMMLRLRGVAPEVVVEVDGWSVIANYVAAGVGISLVPDLCVTEHDGLWRISFARAVPLRRYGAMTRRDGVLALAARRFLSIMVPGSAGTP